ncbi:MAG: hypothetical protein RID11_10300 [Roseovarius sp.]|uniref:hypothetical protein n=1 Tax=Roseovarius sp. TaxID=1486281 RepID=UPI0032EE6E80
MLIQIAIAKMALEQGPLPVSRIHSKAVSLRLSRDGAPDRWLTFSQPDKCMHIGPPYGILVARTLTDFGYRFFTALLSHAA